MAKPNGPHNPIRPKGLKPAAITTEVGADEARDRFGDLLNRTLKGERVLIRKHGKPHAWLLGVDDKALTPAA